MFREAISYLKDLGQYYRVVSTKRSLRKDGGGTDFTSDRFALEGWQAVRALHPKEMHLQVVDVIRETPTTVTIRARRTDGELPPFRAGQYVNVFTEIEGVETSRPYSISSPPSAPHLDLTIKVGQAGFVAPHLIDSLRPGDELVTSAPAGSFYHEPLIHGRDLVFIAAGSGITPFMSALRELALDDEADRPRVHLIYGSRSGDVIFQRELERLARTERWLRLSLVQSKPSLGWAGLSGRIDGDLLGRLVGDGSGKMFYVCGPEGLYGAVEEALRGLGVEQHRLLREMYGPPADVTTESMWPVEVDGGAVFEVELERYGTIQARANEPLLASLERNHVEVPVVCRSGQCGSCRMKVHGGPTFALDDARVRRTDAKNGYVHTCVTYPLGDLQASL